MQRVVLFRFKLVPPSILVSFVREGGKWKQKKETENKGKSKQSPIFLLTASSYYFSFTYTGNTENSSPKKAF